VAISIEMALLDSFVKSGDLDTRLQRIVNFKAYRAMLEDDKEKTLDLKERMCP